MLPSRVRLAQIAVGLLIVVTIRSLAEFLRLYDPAAAAIGPERLMYIYGALAAAVAALLALVLYAIGRSASAVGITAATIAGLLIYKIIVIS